MLKFLSTIIDFQKFLPENDYAYGYRACYKDLYLTFIQNACICVS